MDAANTVGVIATEVTLRYSDMDVLGHLNNAVYATLFEAGRVAYVEQVLTPLMAADQGFVIVKLTVEFKAEARYPGVARILTHVSRVGGSSMVYTQELHVGGRLAATAESVCALFDLTRRKAMRCPDAMRALLKAKGAEG
jgi:acyl-CoA thioester hydrolase